ncbi:MAG: 2-dehydropantoate 2-reductase [Chloroflexota bacterium]|nr:2-dehydropantoate 2-reductase [Chloroflexota bacterium]
MRVGVVGAGAMGGYVAGALARAGNPVTIIDVGPHLDAIRKNGLTVKSHWGDYVVKVSATDDPSTAGVQELVLLSVKTYHNPLVLPRIAPLVGDNTTVLTLQNGLGNYEAVAQQFGARALTGAIYIETNVEAPGVIHQQGDVVRMVTGEQDGHVTPRMKLIQETFAAAGIETEVAGNIQAALWTKFIFVTALAGITAAARTRWGQLIQHPEMRQLLADVLREIETVARARGVALDADVVPQTIAYFESSAADLLASLHMDLEAGRPLELETLTGVVVRLGREAGVPTPVNQTIYALLVPFAQGVKR